jgi:hypothetical protein
VTVRGVGLRKRFPKPRVVRSIRVRGTNVYHVADRYLSLSTDCTKFVLTVPASSSASTASRKLSDTEGHIAGSSAAIVSKRTGLALEHMLGRSRSFLHSLAKELKNCAIQRDRSPFGILDRRTAHSCLNHLILGKRTICRSLKQAVLLTRC